MLFNIKNGFIFIFDSEEVLKVNNQSKNIYLFQSNLDEKLKIVIDYINKLISEKSKINGLILINNIDSFSRNINSDLLTELSDAIKIYSKVGVVIVDVAKKIKPFLMERWLKSLGNNDNGVWLGPGISKQTVISSTVTTRLSKISVKDDFGFIVIDGNPELSKLISFKSNK